MYSSSSSPPSLIELASGQAQKVVAADDFLPMLIYAILRSNPPNLRSNVNFISQFVSPARMQSEAEYQLCSTLSAVTFIENAVAPNFTIDADVFQRSGRDRPLDARVCV